MRWWLLVVPLFCRRSLLCCAGAAGIAVSGTTRLVSIRCSPLLGIIFFLKLCWLWGWFPLQYDQEQLQLPGESHTLSYRQRKRASSLLDNCTGLAEMHSYFLLMGRKMCDAQQWNFQLCICDAVTEKQVEDRKLERSAIPLGARCRGAEGLQNGLPWFNQKAPQVFPALFVCHSSPSPCSLGRWSLQFTDLDAFTRPED